MVSGSRHAMAAVRNTKQLAGFPWDELPKDSVVVDIGGGIGSVSVVLAQAYPHLKFVVEDRAPVVAIAREVSGSLQVRRSRSAYVVLGLGK